jgi:hypothetical protein
MLRNTIPDILHILTAGKLRNGKEMHDGCFLYEF